MVEVSPKGGKRTFVPLLISLLAHLLFLLLFSLFAFRDNAPITLQASLTDPMLPAQETLAALKPRASTFGPTVFFDNQPPAAQQASITPPQEQAQGHKPIDLRELALQNLLATEREHMHDAPHTPAPANIMAATTGFLENLYDKGTDEIERSGDEDKFPSLAEVKYLGYVKRILWCLQKAWKVRFAGKPGLPEGVCKVGIAIDANGNVHETSLISTSRDARLNSLVEQHVAAAAPFPPIPKHLEEDTKIFRIAIALHYEGSRTQGFRFR